MTFTQSLNAFADRVVEKALGAVEAGACVPSHGQRCGCEAKLGTACATQGRSSQLQYSCFGQCNVLNGNACC